MPSAKSRLEIEQIHFEEEIETIRGRKTVSYKLVYRLKIKIIAGHKRTMELTKRMFDSLGCTGGIYANFSRAKPNLISLLHHPIIDINIQTLNHPGKEKPFGNELELNEAHNIPTGFILPGAGAREQFQQIATGKLNYIEQYYIQRQAIPDGPMRNFMMQQQTEDGNKSIDKSHPDIRVSRHKYEGLVAEGLLRNQRHEGGEEHFGGDAQADEKNNHEESVASAVFGKWHGGEGLVSGQIISACNIQTRNELWSTIFSVALLLLALILLLIFSKQFS